MGQLLDAERSRAWSRPPRGWNHRKNLGMMLEFLWMGGAIATVGRDRGECVWDLAERVYPLKAKQPPRGEWLRELVLRQARARGVAKEKRRWGYFVLPMLHHDRLVARLDASADRDAGVLRVHATHLEPAATPETLDGLRALADWLALDEVDVS